MNRFALIVLGLVLLIAAGCRPAVSPSGKPIAGENLVPIPVSDYPDFSDDMDLDGLKTATGASIAYLERLPGDRSFRFGADVCSASRLLATHRRLVTLLDNGADASDIRQWIEEECRVYRSVGSNGNGRMLFTGYYEPLLRGSRYPSDRFPVPVYGMPSDLLTLDLDAFGLDCDTRRLRCRVTPDRKVVPYPDRAAIASGSALSREPALLYLENRVDLFFLQVQGSGKVYLAEGGAVNLGYRDTNGQPYRSIGKVLIDSGKIPRAEMSMQAIREYLTAHPDEADDLLNANPSYVFFEEKAGGPYGCLGVRVTPGRSMAIDRRIFPSAALAYVMTEKPLVSGSGEIASWVPMHRFYHAQDTGGAIRGAGRADLFMGNGPYAEIAAGHLKHPGELYFIVLSDAGSAVSSDSRQTGS